MDIIHGEVKSRHGSTEALNEGERHFDLQKRKGNLVLLTFAQCDDVVLRHTLPVFTGLGRCPIVNWDFAGAVSIFLDRMPFLSFTNDFYQD